MRRLLSGALALAAVAALATPARAYFEEVASGARGVALGPAAVGIVDDVSAYYWNPAALASLRRGEVLLDYAKPYGVPDLNENTLAAAAPWHRWGFAVAWHRLAIGSTYAEDQWSIAAGRPLVKTPLGTLDGGATFKAERVSVPSYYDPDASTNFSFTQSKGSLDAAVRLRMPSNIDLTYVARDLVQPRFELIAGSGGEQQSARQEVSAAIRWHRESTIVVGWSQYAGGGSSINAGMEILFFDVFAIRSGLVNLSQVYESTGSPAQLQFSGGIGVFHNGYYVDAAVLTNRDLGASYRASLSVPFGPRRRP